MWRVMAVLVGTQHVLQAFLNVKRVLVSSSDMWPARRGDIESCWLMKQTEVRK